MTTSMMTLRRRWRSFRVKRVKSRVPAAPYTVDVHSSALAVTSEGPSKKLKVCLYAHVYTLDPTVLNVKNTLKRHTARHTAQSCTSSETESDEWESSRSEPVRRLLELSVARLDWLCRPERSVLGRSDAAIEDCKFLAEPP